ncbi:MAG TPA: single-stranded-DNA-specific exonuclease RecJ [Solirubrobacteraceae bacterium]|jgi:single-stranded-DNA-specific exonuclease|nr:single-stranded-DNA-specific exonuclease RecJ [Solirubrobacteraceae bacterium]
MQPCRFEIPDCPPADVARLRRELGVSGPLAQVLVRRGMAEPALARAFLAGDEEHPPSAFAGIGDAVATVLDHVARGTRITIHGDYDVDGICSTAVLVRALRGLGADVDFYLPDRAGDGYGLNAATVQRLAGRGTRLLVTVDCAITAVEEVAMARALGMDVVVTDHHAPRADGALPHAPLVHPTMCAYPCPELCATAVAHKLAQALLEAVADGAIGAPGSDDPRHEGAKQALEQDLDLVALATIADVVPLLGENRALARRGLRALASTTKPGLRALMAVAGVDSSKVNERAVAFALAPRLNAAGRLYRADAGLELILTTDPVRAAQIAQELDSANRERRQVEMGIRFQAEAQMDELGERSAYVLAQEGWHPGVIGIVASRLVERSGRPVVLIALDGDTGKASGRSVEAFDLLAGLTACGEHLLRYGGHRAAAGLEIDRERVADFADALCAHAERVLAPQDLVTVERVDAIVGGEELGMGLAEELQALAPFGRGNPVACLMVADASFADVRPMGEGKHARFTVESHGVRARAVAFGMGGRLALNGEESVGELRATFTLEVNEWNGVSEPRLVLRRAQIEQIGAETPAAGEEHRGREPAGEEVEAEELVLFAL